MAKSSKIHVKVELDRNPDTKVIQLKTVFNPKAPNVSNDQKDFSWEPTTDEIEFLFQAFNLFPSTSQPQQYSATKEPKDAIPDEKPEETPNEPVATQDKKEPSEPIKDQPPEEEQSEEESQPESEFDKTKDLDEDDFGEKQKDRVLIAADAKTIDEIVKKKRGEGDDTFKEANEDTILDKILRQKKKGEL